MAAMRRLLVSLAILTVALAGCKNTREKPRAAVASDAAAGANLLASPFLWKAEKDGKTSWLFGTIHLGVNAENDLPPWVIDKIDGAAAFVMEADTSDATGLARALQRNDGGSLRTDLGPEYWKKLEDAVGARLAAGFDGMKPFAVMTLLLAKDLPMTPPMDGVLAARARSAARPIHYLESIADQIAMIDPWMTPADVKAMLDHRDEAKVMAQKMLAAYRAGDGPALGAMFDDQTMWLAAGRQPQSYPAYLDALLGKRNRAWVPRLEELHGAGGAFIAVGAGHLVGPGNLLDLLAARGFAITRVGGP
jgi:hypothetical protein